MLKFFRNIRQSLLDQHRIGKYLVYASGEILLVVLGILIALFINNWNDKRKNQQTASEYYCKLVDDFELDQKNIAKLYQESEEKIRISKNILLELPNTQKDKEYFINEYIKAYRTNAFVPSKATITDILSTGKLHLLTNDSLKNRLIRYYAALDNYLYQLELNRSKTLQKAFEYESWIEMGFQYADYAKAALGPEIIESLPINNWQLDPGSKYFRQYQDDLMFFIIMREREKQFFQGILEEMEPLYQALQRECNKE
ncbi:MAG: hypothetical protein KDC24_06075 [Saprospiraceae bacterium]|nr:hypothetical protein [Saprospiraceae bacterium]